MASPGFQLSVEAGRRLFEARRFHEAHERFEEGWRVCRSDEKRVLQVFVLWTAALQQHENGRGGGARRLLARALERLCSVSDDFDGLDVDSLKTCVIDTWGQMVAQEPLIPHWPDAFLTRPSSLTLEHSFSCPSCNEPVMVTVAMEEADGAQYVEDCPVCCRPWSVRVRRDGNDLDVAVRRLDA